jgi:hypothetical protein
VHPLLRSVALLAPLLGAAIRRADSRIQNELRDAEATSPDRATTLSLRSPIARWRLGRLTREGVVHALDAGRYYWDENAWGEFRRARRRRALAVIAVLVLAVGVLWWQGIVG